MGDDLKHTGYYIQQACTLHSGLRLRGGMQFFVKSPTDKTVTLDVAVSDTTEKRRKTIILDVDAFDTIAGVRALIFGREGISSYQLRWVFAGELNEDDLKHKGRYIQKAC